MSHTYDFVIIGAGAAGSVLAYRLSELEDASILLLEAGGPDINDAVESPHRWNEVLLGELDWAYMSEPQEALGGTQIYSASGLGLGGTSNVYHMIHTRGRPEDYDDWAYNGAAGWAYKDVLPYFQKLENQEDDTNPTGGKGGPINVVNAKETGSPISQTFIEACVELGHEEIADHNAHNFGAGWHHVDIKDGKRCGARAAYLDPAMQRANVSVETGALASRLLFEGNRCVGVEYLQDGETKSVGASREVIVSAGAIQSPKLLMLSGIGGAAQLAEHGIDALVDLPGVGENFHDHPLIIGPFGYMDRPGPDPMGNVTEVALFCASEAGMTVPDLEICLVHRAPFGDKFFENVVKRVQTGKPVASVVELVDPKVILSLPGLVRPLSRGWVKLASSDPSAYPRINANYFSEKIDLERTVTMVQIARDIYATQAFKDEWGLIEIAPGAEVQTRDQLRDWVKANIGSYYHFVGTCKMGVDNMAVVDPKLRVHGVDGLRVIDGSIMPAITSANPHTAIVMIGEYGADLIKADM